MNVGATRLRIVLLVAALLVAPAAVADTPSTGAPAALTVARHAIVTFGGPVDDAGEPGPELTPRLERTLELAQRDPAAAIVVTGGSVHSAHVEGQVMRAWLVARGVADARIVVEPLARHTADNGDLVAALLRGSTITRVSLVTSRFHIRRSAFHMRAALRSVGLGAVVVEREPADDGLHGAARAGMAVRESRALVRDVHFRVQAHTLGVRNVARAPAPR